MITKKSVIEFAEHRLEEEERERKLGADNRYDLHYWAAYLDGARAQLKEDLKERESFLMDLLGKELERKDV